MVSAPRDRPRTSPAAPARSATVLLAVLAFAVLALAGCLGQAPPDASPASDEGGDGLADAIAEARATPHVVLALQDNGINPYHVTFRDPSPEAQLHPSLYIPDYPEDAVALNLTFDAEDFWAAVRADCERVWSNIEPGQLYWFPGTKIVGAITLQSAPEPDCDAEQPYVPGILASSHGTMTASRATSFEYGACKECKVVMLEGFDKEGVAWLGDNSDWIDIQSHSWGPVLPGYTGPVDNGLWSADAEFVRTVEASAKQNLAFWASGNGALFRFGVLGHPTVVTPHFTPSVVIVGGHDSGYINTWPGWSPHVISDSCNSWAAVHTSLDESREDVGGGTSGAAPFAAGGAGRILLEARRLLGHTDTGVHDGVVAAGNATGPVGDLLADGELTKAEWRSLVQATASPRPERQYEDGSTCHFGEGFVLYDSTPVQWQDVPEEYPAYVHIGYGAVDNASMALAEQVLRGDAELPDRPDEDRYFALDAEARAALHDVWTAP